MPRNVLTDGEPFSISVINSLLSGMDGEGVVSGLDVSPGGGNFETDVGSGSILLGGDIVAVGADTLNHSSPSAEDRIDLVVAGTGGLEIEQGAPATVAGEPDAPPVPADRVLVKVVYIRRDASEILAGDLFDYETRLGEVVNELLADDAVDTPQIVDDAVTLAKVAAGAVDTPQIVDDAVTHEKALGQGGVKIVDVIDWSGNGFDQSPAIKPGRAWFRVRVRETTDNACFDQDNAGGWTFFVDGIPEDSGDVPAGNANTGAWVDVVFTPSTTFEVTIDQPDGGCTHNDEAKLQMLY